MTSSCTSSSQCQANLPGLSLSEMCATSTFLVFMSLLDELVRSNEKISGACERLKPIETPDDVYDFVVIGGGGAGAVVAARLSENPDWKVLLLEAGPDEPIAAEIPLFSGSVVGTTDIEWGFASSNESYACLAQNGSCSLSAGKMLGGSTSHNGMVYLRGNPTDYDNWAAEGNNGWSWDEVKPYFLKSEDNGEIERVGSFHHSTGGPLSVERFPNQLPFGKSILTAAVEANFNSSDDLNGEQLTGFSEVQTTSKDGVRRSSSRAFLWPARNRSNLHVSINSQATRVLIENQTAVGVEYYKNGTLMKVFVSREVVVSAGTAMSPHVLLHSGIGPKGDLESVGVDVVKDLPGVGENYQNHIGILLSFTSNDTDEYEDDYEAAARYLVNQTGPLSSYGLISYEALLSSNLTSPDFPDVHVYFFGFNQACAPGELDAIRSTDRKSINVYIVNMHPESRGKISLASNDPLDAPVIWGNYLSEPNDIEVIMKGIEMALPLANTEALRARDFTLSSTPVEACAGYDFLSKEYWACAIRQNTRTEGHPAGSCKMGPLSDPLAVVDPQLRVYGIKGLRVADNSIMPRMISGNTAATAMMIGERAADFIKECWSQ